ncbi:MAG: hypothetical protein DRI86_01900 [Bacteroidetes bacterium]|nr:MAG: hypothetical protein DRI86_01900 [Bacteroidota bacterium]
MSKFNYIIIIIFSFISLAGQANGFEAKIAYTVDNKISPFTINFADSSNSVLPIVEWEWTFGNGEISRKQNPNHQYLKAGTYAISLKITNSDGKIDIDYDTLVVSDIALPSCNAYFTYLRNTSAADYTYLFTDHSICTNDSIILWTWDFGDSSAISNAQNPIHQYLNEGLYHVQLTIGSINGCTSSYNVNILVLAGNLDCSANFTYAPDTTSSSQYSMIFHDNSQYSTPILSWKWNFGDGDSSSFQDPQHEFPNAGIYSVKLKIETLNCESEIEIMVQVGNPQRYNFWGRVYVGNQTTDQCVAYLYREYNNNYVIPIDTVNLTSVNDTLGIYYFYQIPEGDYKVQVELPGFSQFHDVYAPTYFDNNVLWNGSQSISLYEDLSLQNIHMKEILFQVGSNYIEGKVKNQANGQLEGVVVFLIDNLGEVINYTHTDTLGDYFFNEVPMGDFYVYGDLTGFASYPAAVSFNSQQDSISNVNFLIKGRSSVGFIEKNVEKNEKSYTIFPNPITDKFLNISFNTNNNYSINYVIYNSVGIEVQNGFISRNTKNFRIELHKLDRGVYFISLVGKERNIFEVKRFIY